MGCFHILVRSLPPYQLCGYCRNLVWNHRLAGILLRRPDRVVVTATLMSPLPEGGVDLQVMIVATVAGVLLLMMLVSGLVKVTLSLRLLCFWDISTSAYLHEKKNPDATKRGSKYGRLIGSH